MHNIKSFMGFVVAWTARAQSRGSADGVLWVDAVKMFSDPGSDELILCYATCHD
jgi:hypothetical protein